MLRPLARRRPTSRRRRLGWFGIGAVVVLVAGGVVAYVATSGPGPGPVWSDEFDGAAGAAPDPANWSMVTGGDGFGNNELECYTTERNNSALDGDGHLVITADYHKGYKCADGEYRDYTSARLTTKGLHTFG